MSRTDEAEAEAEYQASVIEDRWNADVLWPWQTNPTLLALPEGENPF